MKIIYSALKQKFGLALLAIAFAFCFCANAFCANITNMRIGQQIGGVRIVFDADTKFDYKVFLLTTPKRLVVDALGVNVNKTLDNPKNNLISVTRVGKLNETDKRIVFDLHAFSGPRRSILALTLTLPSTTRRMRDRG